VFLKVTGRRETSDTSALLELSTPKHTQHAMLWIKSLHIVVVASWFAGLFYLPRIFVNLAMVPADSVAERDRLLLMAGKLLRFTTYLAVPALVFGLWLFLGYGIGRGPGNGWMHAKLLVVVLALGYHHACGSLLKKFRRGANTRSHGWYRWFNEVPVVLLLLAVILVVVKPF
jgi:putative membrane protein